MQVGGHDPIFDSSLISANDTGILSKKFHRRSFHIVENLVETSLGCQQQISQE